MIPVPETGMKPVTFQPSLPLTQHLLIDPNVNCNQGILATIDVQTLSWMSQAWNNDEHGGVGNSRVTAASQRMHC